MPNWGEHFLIANKVLEKAKLDKNLFLFGNILPDVQNGYLVKGISITAAQSVDHFWLEKVYEHKQKRGYEVFNEKYSNKMKNPVVAGYFAHLLADTMWNDMFYQGKCKIENEKPAGYTNNAGVFIKSDTIGCKNAKHKDFWAFQYYIYEKYNLEIPKYSPNIVEEIKVLENIKINDEDVKKVIKYINETKDSAKDKDKKLEIFTEDELKDKINQCVEKTLEYLEKFGIEINR